MFRFLRLSYLWCVVIVLGIGCLAFARPVLAFESPPLESPQMGSQAALAPICVDGEQNSGAKYRLCLPISTSLWNHDLLVYAHGYVAFNRPVEIPEDQMSLNGMSIAGIATQLGYGFAATSYYTNGLAVLPALEDLVDVVSVFSETYGMPNHVYLVGVSEGGLITTLAVESRPDVFDGGLAMCGPYGDFQQQINYLGDFRVVFDYFLPGVIPESPMTIPIELIDTWSTYYSETIQPALQDPVNAISITQLLSVTQVSYVPADPTTKLASMETLLWYNVFSTNDGKEKLGGLPFGNLDRVYAGSSDDAALNTAVARFNAAQTALNELEAHYHPTGKLRVPVVTLHNTGDPLVPYWHATHYSETVAAAGRSLYHVHYASHSYGHCNFTLTDVTMAFSQLVVMVNNPPHQLFLPLIVRTSVVDK